MHWLQFIRNFIHTCFFIASSHQCFQASNPLIHTNLYGSHMPSLAIYIGIAFQKYFLHSLIHTSLPPLASAYLHKFIHNANSCSLHAVASAHTKFHTHMPLHWPQPSLLQASDHLIHTNFHGSHMPSLASACWHHIPKNQFSCTAWLQLLHIFIHTSLQWFQS